MTAALAKPVGEGREPVLATAPHRIGQVALTVRDLERVSRFYQSALGLQVVERAPGVERLGAGGTVLVELRHDPAARSASREEAGLYHIAFLLPDRVQLGAWLAFALRQGLPLAGAADHRVSEAVYLSDPEGNGIEIYADRPSAAWWWRDGKVTMSSDPLDLDALVRAAGGRDWSGFPEDGTVGHVHLQVGDIAEAEAFYGGILGLDVTGRYPGANFYGSGGYHHQLATNVWKSRGASPRSGGATGLAEVEILAAQDVIDAVRSRAPMEAVAAASERISLRDPWGISITLRSAERAKKGA